MRRELARLEHERVAGRQARRDLPGGLEERVVPRGDQAAHPHRVVHDPADHVGVAGVDDPSGLVVGRVPEVPEHRDHVVDVVLALDQALAGVEGLRPGDDVLVSLEQVGDAQQQVTSLACRGARPGALVEGAPRRADGCGGVLGSGLVDGRHELPVGGAPDLPAARAARGQPRSVDVDVRHPHLDFRRVAYGTTDCHRRNAVLAGSIVLCARDVKDLRAVGRIRDLRDGLPRPAGCVGRVVRVGISAPRLRVAGGRTGAPGEPANAWLPGSAPGRRPRQPRICELPRRARSALGDGSHPEVTDGARPRSQQGHAAGQRSVPSPTDGRGRPGSGRSRRVRRPRPARCRERK